MPLIEFPIQLEEASWKLECIFATGLGPEAFWALAARARTLPLALAPGSTTKVVIGRAHQTEMFEALLNHEPNLLGCISRSHVQIEEVKMSDVASERKSVSIDTVPEDETPAILVTNMSTNVIVANRVNLQPSPLYQNDSAKLRDGDTLSFATEQPTASAATEEGANTPTPPPPRSISMASVATAAATKSNNASEAQETEANLAVVPFLTFRVIAPPPPPPPSPFVMVSPPSVTVAPQPPDGVPGYPVPAEEAPQGDNRLRRSTVPERRSTKTDRGDGMTPDRMEVTVQGAVGTTSVELPQTPQGVTLQCGGPGKGEQCVMQ